MSDRPTFPRSLVTEVFLEIGKWFDPTPAWQWDRNERSRPAQRPHALVERLCAVGGYRRRKGEMKDLVFEFVGLEYLPPEERR